MQDHAAALTAPGNAREVAEMACNMQTGRHTAVREALAGAPTSVVVGRNSQENLDFASV
jgi:hypothetical protein